MHTICSLFGQKGRERACYPPDQLINHYFLVFAGFSRVDCTCFCLPPPPPGLGDPVLAPTALQAIASGTVYLAARFPNPKRLGDLPNHPILNQHPFATNVIGAPYAETIDLEQPPTVVWTKIQAAAMRRFEPMVPPGYDLTSHAKNLLEILKPTTVADVCSRIK